MSISLTRAFENVNRYYNKPEMSQYYFVAVLLPIIIMAIFGSAGFASVQQMISGNISQDQVFMLVLSFLGIYIIIFIISMIMSVVINGMYINAVHNAISGKPVIFPSLFSDFGKIFKTGGIYLGCTIIASIACSIINQVLSGFVAPISAAAQNGDAQTAATSLTIAGVILSAIYLLQMVFLWLMMISFSRKMKFAQFFDFSWCWKLLTKRVKELTMLGIYDILLFIPIIITIICFTLYLIPVIKDSAGSNSPDSIISLIGVFAVVFIVIYIYYIYIQIINIDLISQIIGKKREVDRFNRL